MFKPVHLSPQEIDAVYIRSLKQLEAMHLTALINERVHQAAPPGHWDTETGEALIEAVRAEWESLRVASAEEA